MSGVIAPVMGNYNRQRASLNARLVVLRTASCGHHFWPEEKVT